MGNTMIYSDYSSMEVFHQSPTTYSLEITWTAESSRWKRYVCF